MPPNILTALKSISDFSSNDLHSYSSTYLNRINAAGEQLEFYLKDAFSGSFRLKQANKEKKHISVFCYLGNQNNPPDMILKNGDAFEIKKIEKQASAIALNSSYPKDRLHSDDKRITIACRNCEQNAWKEKDLFYVVGCASHGKIKQLFFVHGLCYAANREVYERIESPIRIKVSSLIKSMGLEGSETNELGKIKRVDPLGITDLRIRGMWHIQNPNKVFAEIMQHSESKFNISALLTRSKYRSFPLGDRQALEKNSKIRIKDVKIKDPNNPAKILEAKFIYITW